MLMLKCVTTARRKESLEDEKAPCHAMCHLGSCHFIFRCIKKKKKRKKKKRRKKRKKKSKTLEDKSRKTEHQNTRLLPIIWRWSEKKPKNPSCFDVFRRGKGAGLGGLRWKKNHNTPIKEAHIKVYSGFRVMGGDRKQVVTMLASHQRSFNAHIFSF